MKGVQVTSSNTYESGDFVSIMDDSHIFGGMDLQNGRIEISLIGLSQSDTNKLLLPDSKIKVSSFMQLPQFRSESTSNRNLKQVKRRKYYFDSGVKLKQIS
jgi:hypothetical protein